MTAGTVSGRRRIAFRIGQPGEASVRVDLRVQFDRDASVAKPGTGTILSRSRTRKLIIHWNRRSPKLRRVLFERCQDSCPCAGPPIVRHAGDAEIGL